MCLCVYGRDVEMTSMLVSLQPPSVRLTCEQSEFVFCLLSLASITVSGTGKETEKARRREKESEKRK